MIPTRNSFRTYVKTKSTSIRIYGIRNHKLKGKIIDIKPNKIKVDFGHYKNSKITATELSKCFKYNRKILPRSNQTDLLNNKISFILKEITPQKNPILQSPVIKSKPKTLINKLDSLTLLKRAFIFKKLINGRIIRKIRGGFLVVCLGVFAFLPMSHFIAGYRSRQYKNLNIKKTKLLFTQIPLEILGIKCLKSKSTYIKPGYCFLNVVVSVRKALKTLEKHHKFLNTKKLVRIAKLKNCKEFKHI